VLRIAFLRKNKTLLSIFKQKGVVALLEKNYRVVCQLRNEPLDASFDMKEKISHLLTSNGFAIRRSRTMEIDDFLTLLLVFNKEGIHFA